jgi:hypothetical protein
MRQWLGVLAGPVVLPALVTLSIALRLKIVAFSNRDLTAWTRSALLGYERRRQLAASRRQAQQAVQATPPSSKQPTEQTTE